MTTDAQQTITPEKQQAAAQVGGLFNSLHSFLETLKHTDANGNKLMSEQLRNAHARIEEAGTWAVKHVLVFGPPPAPPKADAPANDEPGEQVPVDAPAPLGVIDPSQSLPTANASGTESV